MKPDNCPNQSYRPDIWRLELGGISLQPVYNCDWRAGSVGAGAAFQATDHSGRMPTVPTRKMIEKKKDGNCRENTKSRSGSEPPSKCLGT